MFFFSHVLAFFYDQNMFLKPRMKFMKFLNLKRLTVGKKGYFFRETLDLFNRSSDVGDPFR
jgi:hypothetical protein